MTEATRSSAAYEAIKRGILTGEHPPGRILTERHLAEKAEISRTPLRAAIQRLEQEGIIARLSNGTLMVREVTLEQFMEINEVRRILEGTAAAEAATRARETGLSAGLLSAREVMRCYAEDGEATFDAFWTDDDAFHRAVAAAAGMEILPQMVQELRETARRGTITHLPAQFSQQAAEHLAVIDAIEAGNATAARTAMESHFDSVRQRLMGWLMRR